MNHLGMSVAPTSLTKALDSVGEDFDGEFKVWKKQLSCHFSREMEAKKEVEILKQKLTESEAPLKGKIMWELRKQALIRKLRS